MEFADGECLDERRPHLRRDDVLAVRLAVVGGELRQKLVVGDACGGVEPCLLLDLRTDRERDIACQRNPLQVFRDVKICLVQGERFDNWRVLGEDLADLLGNSLVDLEARFHEYQVRTLSLRRHRWHRRSDTELAGFVACGRDNATLA